MNRNAINQSTLTVWLEIYHWETTSGVEVYVYIHYTS